MSSERPKQVVHQDSLPWAESSHGSRYASRRKQLGAAAGGRQIGCSLFEIPPGKRSFPLHYHLANEEALYVLDGEGTLRLGEGETRVGPGDYVALPVGPDTAHQLINDGGKPLRYLVVSTMIEPDVLVYPDSKKFGLMAGAAPGGEKEKRTLLAYVPDVRVDYWEGED